MINYKKMITNRKDKLIYKTNKFIWVFTVIGTIAILFFSLTKANEDKKREILEKKAINTIQGKKGFFLNLVKEIKLPDGVDNVIFEDVEGIDLESIKPKFYIRKDSIQFLDENGNVKKEIRLDEGEYIVRGEYGESKRKGKPTVKFSENGKYIGVNRFGHYELYDSAGNMIYKKDGFRYFYLKQDYQVISDKGIVVDLEFEDDGKIDFYDIKGNKKTVLISYDIGVFPAWQDSIFSYDSKYFAFTPFEGDNLRSYLIIFDSIGKEIFRRSTDNNKLAKKIYYYNEVSISYDNKYVATILDKTDTEKFIIEYTRRKSFLEVYKIDGTLLFIEEIPLASYQLFFSDSNEYLILVNSKNELRIYDIPNVKLLYILKNENLRFIGGYFAGKLNAENLLIIKCKELFVFKDIKELVLKIPIDKEATVSILNRVIIIKEKGRVKFYSY